MSKKLEETLTMKLQARMVPDPAAVSEDVRTHLNKKARAKARSTVRGVYLMTVGTLLLLAGLGLVVVPIFQPFQKKHY